MSDPNTPRDQGTRRRKAVKTVEEVKLLADQRYPVLSFYIKLGVLSLAFRYPFVEDNESYSSDNYEDADDNCRWAFPSEEEGTEAFQVVLDHKVSWESLGPFHNWCERRMRRWYSDVSGAFVERPLLGFVFYIAVVRRLLVDFFEISDQELTSDNDSLFTGCNYPDIKNAWRLWWKELSSSIVAEDLDRDEDTLRIIEQALVTMVTQMDPFDYDLDDPGDRELDLVKNLRSSSVSMHPYCVLKVLQDVSGTLAHLALASFSHFAPLSGLLFDDCDTRARGDGVSLWSQYGSLA